VLYQAPELIARFRASRRSIDPAEAPATS
jgi:hypothetical protein